MGCEWAAAVFRALLRLNQICAFFSFQHTEVLPKWPQILSLCNVTTNTQAGCVHLLALKSPSEVKNRQEAVQRAHVYAERKQNPAVLRSAARLATAIRFQLQERVTAILCVCVCVCDLRGQVTGIRVRGEDGWLRGDDMQTHTVVTQKLARQVENIRSVSAQTSCCMCANATK